MNAQEARQLATGIVTEEQQQIARAATGQIEQAAKLGRRSTTLSARRPQWLATYLRDQGYTVTDTSSQHDGPSLQVEW